MKRVLLCLLSYVCVFEAQSAQVVNVEYIHKIIKKKWDIELPYNSALVTPKVVANMEYLLAAVDATNRLINGVVTTDYANGEYATTAAVDTIAADRAVETLVRYERLLKVSLDYGDGVFNDVLCLGGKGCVLPDVPVTKDKEAFTGKWCTELNGGGDCWRAGQHYDYEDFDSDVTLYADWKPVYKISVVVGSGEYSDASIPVPDTFWLLYGEKWCADKDCKSELINLAKLPELDGYEFTGIQTIAMSWIGVSANEIVDKFGNFVKTDAVLTTARSAASARSYWTLGKTYCAPGTYYVGHGTQYGNAYCKSCSVGHYCAGGEFETTYQDYTTEKGLSECPDGGKTLISGADNSSYCVKTGVDYVAAHGSGTADCYLGETGAYDNSCFNYQLTKCAAGYWRGSEADADCSPVGYGYYSMENSIARSQCKNSGVTDIETASSVVDCYKFEICEEVGTRKCFYNFMNGAYSNCSVCAQ